MAILHTLPTNSYTQDTNTIIALDAWHEATTKRAHSIIAPWGTEASHVLNATAAFALAGAVTLFSFERAFSGRDVLTAAKTSIDVPSVIAATTGHLVGVLVVTPVGGGHVDFISTAIFAFFIATSSSSSIGSATDSPTTPEDWNVDYFVEIFRSSGSATAFCSCVALLAALGFAVASTSLVAFATLQTTTLAKKVVDVVSIDFFSVRCSSDRWWRQGGIDGRRNAKGDEGGDGDSSVHVDQMGGYGGK